MPRNLRRRRARKATAYGVRTFVPQSRAMHAAGGHRRISLLLPLTLGPSSST